MRKNTRQLNKPDNLPHDYCYDLSEALKNSSIHALVLNALKNFKEEDLWLGGGFVRNLIWGLAHNKMSRYNDIDVFYFNRCNKSSSAEKNIENELKKKFPLVKWSVVNQARMHTYNNEEQYSNLSDAISKFPDTASAVICRLDSEDNLKVIAPLGLVDLFNLIVRPTPHFKSSPKKMEVYYNRIIKKKWLSRWSKLRLVDSLILKK